MITQAIDSNQIPSQKDKVSYKFYKFAKTSNCGTLQNVLHAMHLLKGLDKMYKYTMDLACIVKDTEQTWFHPQMDRWTKWTQYTPFNFVEVQAIIKNQIFTLWLLVWMVNPSNQYFLHKENQ